MIVLSALIFYVKMSRGLGFLRVFTAGVSIINAFHYFYAKKV